MGFSRALIAGTELAGFQLTCIYYVAGPVRPAGFEILPSYMLIRYFPMW